MRPMLAPVAAVKAALQAYVDKDRSAIEALVAVNYSFVTAQKFRNAEVHRVRDVRIVPTEVHFGWDLPHKADPETFIQS
jgi:hypothetical protein